MLQFNGVDDSSYRILFNKNYKKDDLNNVSTFKHITECSDPDCAYTRNKTNIRDHFEKRIVGASNKFKNLKILFYGSFLLYQELKLVLLLNGHISEVHFTDYAYKNILTNNDMNYVAAFEEFFKFLNSKKINIKVYIHTDPDKLATSLIFRRRFDIICGIDIDYVKGNTNNRPIMKKIAENTLSINGLMYVSQNYIDQMDLCCYEISSDGKIKLTHTEDFVKDNYYQKYWVQSLMDKIKYPIAFIGVMCGFLLSKKNPILSIMTGTFFTVDILHKYLLDWDSPKSFEREIKKFNSLIK
ncbi:putative ORFan [Tupanvirus deep ocean]|uniref:ORFan n=2 Tax=Tupanvirus TaxID=2094720 RepID=A0AC62A753_9VIRU|nr:putative ORFan [Tupanvirus deep ocean]QKU33477.1 putative ORFan [Tupanvirus deep ocean]